MSETLAVGNWFVGSNGNWFADIGGYRYCVALIDGRDNASGYMVAKNGMALSGPDAQPGRSGSGHRTADSAKKYAEWYADMNGAR